MPRILTPPNTGNAELNLFLQGLSTTFNGQVHLIQCQPDGAGLHGTHRIKALADGENCYFEFQVPDDYREISKAYVYFIPTTTGTFDWTVSTTCGGVTEDEGSNADSATADGSVSTDDVIGRVDCTDAFTNVEPGDLVGVKFTVDVLTTTTSINVSLFTFGYYEGIKQ